MPPQKHNKLTFLNQDQDTEFPTLSQLHPKIQQSPVQEQNISSNNQLRRNHISASNIPNPETMESKSEKEGSSEMKKEVPSKWDPPVNGGKFNKFASKPEQRLESGLSKKVQEKLENQYTNSTAEKGPVKKGIFVPRTRTCTWINPTRTTVPQNNVIRFRNSAFEEPRREQIKSEQPIVQIKQENRGQRLQNRADEVIRSRNNVDMDIYKNEMMERYKKYLKRYEDQTSESDHNDCLMSEEEDENVDRLEEIESRYTISDFKLANHFHKVIRGSFVRPGILPYSTHYEYSRARKYTKPVEHAEQIEWIKLGHLRFLNINLDLNIPSRGKDPDHEEQLAEECELKGFKRKTKVYYGQVTDEQRAYQFMKIIRLAMMKGVDFILIQEGYQSLARRLLLELINQLANSDFAKYYYPQNLDDYDYNRSTLILSKHPVRFGQLRFEMIDHDNQESNKFYFPLQAFCEFEIMIDNRIESIAIFNCHLRSNGQKKSKIAPCKMRQKQFDCIYDWCKKKNYDRFFIIGDTNMPSGQKFKSQNLEADTKFFDAFDQGFTPIGGTYLYRNERNQIVDERMDRVLMNKGCEKKTVVEIQYEDVLLKSCEGKRLDKWKMLAKYEDELTYITLSDHKLMNITIYMTKNK